ncbi:hypothetical protein AAF712_013251 [Marasmius tenuissimus]|uniref:Uncharacterized protein n=1 Tax=Marasmius tenuissimus TaxID=585030 RepID=A0ABR2ZE64_9AGAR
MAEQQGSPIQGSPVPSDNSNDTGIAANPVPNANANAAITLTLNGITLHDILDTVPDIETWSAIGPIHQQDAPHNAVAFLNWHTQLTEEQRNACAGYLRFSPEQIPFELARYRNDVFIQQNSYKTVLLRPVLGGSLFVKTLSDQFTAQVRALLTGLGAALGDIEIITPQPWSRELAAKNKNAAPGTYIAVINNPVVRNILTDGRVWSKDDGFTFFTHAANSTRCSWTVAVYDANCNGLTITQAKSLLRWLILAHFINHSDFRSFVHAATPNDTHLLTLRVVEYLAAHDMVLLTPHPNPNGGSTRLAVTAPTLDVDYETMKRGRLIFRQKDLVSDAYSFTISHRYLPDRRALSCTACGLDWHVNADCPLLTVPDYNRPWGTISEFAEGILGGTAVKTAWARIRGRRTLPNLEAYNGEESDEWSPPD